MKTKLKPCPFCGGKAYINNEYEYHHSSPYGIEVVCEDCTARIQFDDRYTTEQQAITAWNRRPNER